jgi:hypothetical protein
MACRRAMLTLQVPSVLCRDLVTVSVLCLLCMGRHSGACSPAVTQDTARRLDTGGVAPCRATLHGGVQGHQANGLWTLTCLREQTSCHISALCWHACKHAISCDTRRSSARGMDAVLLPRGGGGARVV